MGAALKVVRPTERQKRVLEVITKYLRNRGYPPTIRDVADAMGFRSPNGVMCHLRALERLGLIERDPGTARGIRLLAIDHH